MDQLRASSTIQEVVLASFPVLFVQQQVVDEVRVVFKLRVNGLNIQIKLFHQKSFDKQQATDVVEGGTDVFCQFPDTFALTRADPAKNAFC
jgi:hypothetical protein